MMNETTSGCGNCCYYFNGQCTKVDKCMGNSYSVTSNHTIGINEAYNHTIGINECGSNLPDDIVNNLPDDYTVITLPELAIPCFICGKETTISMWQSGPGICDECKQAIAWAKAKMKEKDNVENRNSL